MTRNTSADDFEASQFANGSLDASLSAYFGADYDDAGGDPDSKFTAKMSNKDGKTGFWKKFSWQKLEYVESDQETRYVGIHRNGKCRVYLNIEKQSHHHQYSLPTVRFVKGKEKRRGFQVKKETPVISLSDNETKKLRKALRRNDELSSSGSKLLTALETLGKL